MSYAIVTDTSANLPGDLLARHELAVLPLSFTIEGEQRVNLAAQDFDAAAFFDAMRAGAKVTTSQIPPQSYIDCFEPLLLAGRDVLFVGMSSGISGSFHSATLAASELCERYPDRRIRCVDTGTASLGEGLQVLRAAELREQGKSLDEAAGLLLDERPHMCSIFTVDDLKYLLGTGRLSGVVKFVGSMLNVKPILKGNEEGKIVLAGAARGRRRVIADLAARYDANVVDAKEQTVGVAHAGCRDSALELIKLLHRNHPPKKVLLVDYEPVTGSHIGPGALALFFRGDENVRGK